MIFMSTVLSSFLPTCVCMTGLRHHIESQVLGLRASWSELAFLIFVHRIIGTAFAIRCFVLQQVRENFGALMGCGCRRCGWPQCAAHTAKKRPKRAGTRAETLCGHAQGATGAIV